MTANPLENRRMGLEAEYFAREEASKLAALRRARAAAGSLLELGESDDMLAALELLPLFEIAWSDGRLDTAERELLLDAVQEAGIEPDSSSRRLVESWLRVEPPPDLHAAWRIHMMSRRSMHGGQRDDDARRTMLLRARDLIRRSGGAFRARAISSTERRVLEEIEEVSAA
jgi:hypothetical protein